MENCRAKIGTPQLSRGIVPLFGAVLCGIFAIYLNSFPGWSVKYFGDGPVNTIVWTVVTVPCYTYLAIFFVRFLGSYLARAWLREVSQSTALREATIYFCAGIVKDARVPALFANFTQQPTIVCALNELTLGLLEDKRMQAAASSFVAGVLASPSTRDAAAGAMQELLIRPELHRSMAATLGADVLAQPLAQQITRVLQDERVGGACVDMLTRILEDVNVKQTLHARTASLLHDKKVLRAGCSGVRDAIACCEAPSSTSEFNINTSESSLCDDQNRDASPWCLSMTSERASLSSSSLLPEVRHL